MNHSAKILRRSAIAGIVSLTCFSSFAAQYLPPELPWQGKSLSLISKDANWQTVAERTDFKLTSSYEQAKIFAKQLAAASDKVNYRVVGKSPQGRDIFILTANRHGWQQPDDLVRDSKPTFFVHGGIHSGEIDGKEAGFMLLRDIIQNKDGRAALLDKVNFVFMPILSVDAHERSGPYNRSNQRGPENPGWRVSEQRINLNRDFTKLDAPEMQSLLHVLNKYQPDLYYDVHVTDGEDYQYDITFGYNRADSSLSPAIAEWLEGTLRKKLETSMAPWGHTAGPLIFGIDNKDFSKGIVGWTASPRYSNGYAELRHIPMMLIENHSLKAWKQRVLGTYVLIEQSMHILADNHEALTKAVETDKARRYQQQTVAWSTNKTPEKIASFKGVAFEAYDSVITGDTEVRWLGTPKTYVDLPMYQQNVAKTVIDVPTAYYVPVQYQDIIQKLAQHNIQFELVGEDGLTTQVRELTATSHKFEEKPFEGHFRVSATFDSQVIEKTLLPGTAIVKTDQPLGKLAVAVLQPEAPDSFFAWGFFNGIFQLNEFIETYVLSPYMEQVFEQDKALKREFEQKLATDPEFANDKRARVMWLYERTPFIDKSWKKYPVLLSKD